MQDHTTGISDKDIAVRKAELINHNWDRSKSTSLALSENIALSHKHWAVITFLRKSYLNYGSAKHARLLSEELNNYFNKQGGNKYLRQLFPGGPVAQGCRLANLRIPENSVDKSFGTSY